MVPGVLPPFLGARPLTRISPSRFLSLRKCPLREVRASAKENNLLPTSPASRLGTIIHRLLEDAGKGRVTNINEETLWTRWDELVTSNENEMAISWLERSLVPLRDSVRDYEVRRIRVFKRLMKQFKQTLPDKSHSLRGNGFGFEVWVESNDGSVGGKIDQVTGTPDAPIIRDYKSGQIAEIHQGEIRAQIKNDYQIQLELYAALYKATHGLWPEALEIVPLTGNCRSFPCISSECDELLELARRTRQEINETIGNANQNPSPGFTIDNALGQPHSETCRYCLYRPRCPAYQKAETQESDQKWPGDIWGTIREILYANNGTKSLRVEGERIEKGAVIRHLNPSEERHPAWNYLSAGKRVSIFNLKGPMPGQGYVETPLTTIYSGD
jgi:RecB family exonuclease